MKFTTFCIKETLRLSGFASETFLREALIDHDLGGIHIKKGTKVQVPLYLM